MRQRSERERLKEEKGRKIVYMVMRKIRETERRRKIGQ